VGGVDFNDGFDGISDDGLLMFLGKFDGLENGEIVTFKELAGGLMFADFTRGNAGVDREERGLKHAAPFGRCGEGVFLFTEKSSLLCAGDRRGDAPPKRARPIRPGDAFDGWR